MRHSPRKWKSAKDRSWRRSKRPGIWDLPRRNRNARPSYRGSPRTSARDGRSMRVMSKLQETIDVNKAKTAVSDDLNQPSLAEAKEHAAAEQAKAAGFWPSLPRSE